MQLIGSPAERELTRHSRTINSFCDLVVNARRREAEEGAPLGPDLLSRFLDDAKKKGENVTNEEMRDIVLNFIIAGRDTTACALVTRKPSSLPDRAAHVIKPLFSCWRAVKSWSMLELSRHPDVAARCRLEVDQVVPLESSPLLHFC